MPGVGASFYFPARLHRSSRFDADDSNLFLLYTAELVHLIKQHDFRVPAEWRWCAKYTFCPLESCLIDVAAHELVNLLGWSRPEDAVKQVCTSTPVRQSSSVAPLPNVRTSSYPPRRCESEVVLPIARDNGIYSIVADHAVRAHARKEYSCCMFRLLASADQDTSVPPVASYKWQIIFLVISSRIIGTPLCVDLVTCTRWWRRCSTLQPGSSSACVGTTTWLKRSSISIDFPCLRFAIQLKRLSQLPFEPS